MYPKISSFRTLKLFKLVKVDKHQEGFKAMSFYACLMIPPLLPFEQLLGVSEWEAGGEEEAGERPGGPQSHHGHQLGHVTRVRLGPSTVRPHRVLSRRVPRVHCDRVGTCPGLV